MTPDQRHLLQVLTDLLQWLALLWLSRLGLRQARTQSKFIETVRESTLKQFDFWARQSSINAMIADRFGAPPKPPKEAAANDATSH